MNKHTPYNRMVLMAHIPPTTVPLNDKNEKTAAHPACMANRIQMVNSGMTLPGQMKEHTQREGPGCKCATLATVQQQKHLSTNTPREVYVSTSLMSVLKPSKA